MAEIKRIQLRGISRTPSDRLTEDGGCAESLNVYMDNSELAPAITPEEVTAELGLPDDTSFSKIFLHKMQGGKNTIVLYFHNMTEKVGHAKEGNLTTIVPLNTGETLVDIVSIGNTLVMTTTEHIRYALYKGGKYHYLGERIPEPQIEFRCKKVSLESSRNFFDLFLLEQEEIKEGEENLILLLDPSTWEQTAKDISLGIENDNTKELSKIQNDAWNKLIKLDKEAKRGGSFLAPFLVRYAVELYDGTYIYQSVPILLGAGSDKWMNAHAFYSGPADHSPILSHSSFIRFYYDTAYKASAFLHNWDTEGWEDIVKSVHIFASTDIRYPAMNAPFSGLTVTKELDTFGYAEFDVDFYNGEKTDLKALEDEILSKSNFYKIASFSLGDTKLQEGFDLSNGNAMYSQDTLQEQDRLPDYEQSGTEIVPSKVTNFNNRLLALGAHRLLPTGYSFLPSTIIKTEKTTPASYALDFRIPGTDGVTHKVVSKNPNGDPLMQTYVIDGNYAESYGLVFFPDARCNKMHIWLGGGDVAVIDMKPHPFLNCSYAFWGLSKTLKEHNGQVGADVDYSDFIANENRKETDVLRLYQSSANNPFHFPLSGNYTLPAPGLGLAIASTALSQGQFGQFPLYIFTEEGIWVLETAADGSLVSSKPLSRDVCSNPDSITPIDQAVVFVTDKGVMLLQGSQISELSPFMNGKHYTIENSPRVIIEGQEQFSNLLPAITDNTQFMSYIKDASVAYDYAGKKLMFIKSGESYQYIYNLDTQTWHKISSGRNLRNAVNSYPECFVASVKNRIYNFSTILDTEKAQTTLKSIVATRPFDLGEPDVFKTITDVRIRGQFPKGAVKFILLGSNDGINFATVSTLRGRAWKLFRMVILADLAPTERISWVDIMYDTKFTNKLR